MVADSSAKIFDGLFQKPLHPPQTLAAAHFVKKIAENPAAVGGVADLGMKLQPVNRPRPVSGGSDRAGIGGGQGNEFAVDRLNLVTVAHPHDTLLGNAGK